MANFWDPYRTLLQRGQDFHCPTTAHLDRYEQETGFLLPKSYCDFAVTFGTGQFTALPNDERQRFTYVLPNFPEEPNSLIRRLRKPSSAAPGDDLIDRILVFGNDLDSTLFGWDPATATDPTDHEYAIYELADGEVEGDAVATSFREFILKRVFLGRLDLMGLSTE